MTLDRRDFLSACIAASLLAASPRVLAADTAASVYASSLVIEGLGDPGGLSEAAGADLNAREIADVRASGLTAAHLTVGSVGTMAPLEAFEQIMNSIAHWERQIDASPDVFSRIRSAADISAAKRDGRTGLIYGLQDGVAFEDDLDRLDTLHRFGIRVIQPTYNRRNLLGDGSMEPANAGLSRTGVDAIAKLNALGILVDLSHCGRRTAADAIAASKKPVAFTHTGCAALVEHPRHRTDQEIRAVAEGGGVIGIYVMPYLSRGKQPAAADVLAHIEHALDVAGSDHVSIGTDGHISAMTVTDEFRARFREITRSRQEAGIAAPYETEEGYLFANDLNTPRRFETLSELLLKRGHSEATVSKVLGGNMARVFADTWA